MVRPRQVILLIGKLNSPITNHSIYGCYSRFYAACNSVFKKFIPRDAGLHTIKEYLLLSKRHCPVHNIPVFPIHTAIGVGGSDGGGSSSSSNSFHYFNVLTKHPQVHYRCRVGKQNNAYHMSVTKGKRMKKE
jgi:hypothetical protein